MPISQEVLEQLGISEETLANIMIAEMRTIFRDLVGIDNAFRAPVLADPIDSFTKNVTAIVGLAGSNSGLLRLHLPEKMALDIASGMLKTYHATVDSDVLDAIGELVNVMAGSFKLHLTNHGNQIGLSLPSTFAGNEYYFTSKAVNDSTACLLYTSPSPRD